MDIGQIRAFLAVAEELHFGRAAERLHIAQPPLSRTIKRLERELGTTLFDRNTRSVTLTDSGKALISPANDVLDAARRAQAAVRSADDGDVGLVRIAFAGVSTHRLLARLARVVRSERPGIELELSSQNFAQPAMRKLLDGETDLALGRWDIVPPEVSARVVMPDSLVLAVADTHTSAAAGRISIADVATEPFVALPPHEGSVLSDRLRRLAGEHGFVADIVQIAPDTQTALALVSAEVGCHLTLASVAGNVTDPHVVFLPLIDSTPDVDLRVAWRTADTSPALRAVLQEVMNLDPGLVADVG
ncbi:LysR family transcriptional regulator [Nocardia cyriacigeorgica]|uniref:LysR family transcriptional regulator n=2 Tax=Nocardia cyriacigeorgica TaxID=135487 RepID=A0A6P1D6L7_9NOCA|nr:LysR substrate-binding domain-containing protein [Nocardia cyriacigeorgica]NEW37582.1 LysR family transcriptional regulator [Nocardia cyriacigeorgica]NEW45024.1 LysR family transcriptional regulator [Nocardia cyriacigeorgica]NEW49030.1 LysR family transcriptional regulator [Nocardia cyriacigeorgica]NEW55131.1 LysR family transcriptional regulator [Nocardia cyriacigeorgica]